jgi:predicted CXXCH cytochrome family protein
MMSSMKCGECHTKMFEAMPVTGCRDCHDSVSGLHVKGEHKEASCTDCHKPHSWAVKGRELCLGCHSDMKDHNKEGGACTKCHDFRGRKA